MQAIIAILMSLGLITSPSQVRRHGDAVKDNSSVSGSVMAASTSSTSGSWTPYTVNVDGTPVIIDIQEF